MIVEHLPDDLRPYEGRKPFVVATFAYQDVARVEPWLRALVRAGVRVWFDRGGGADRPDAMERTIFRSAGLLLFRTEHSAASRSVRRDLELARAARRPIGAVMLDSGVAPSDAAFTLSSEEPLPRLLAALPVGVRELSRAERRQAGRSRPASAASVSVSGDGSPGLRISVSAFAASGDAALDAFPDLAGAGFPAANVPPPLPSDRCLLYYLPLAVFLGWLGIQFLYAERRRWFWIQLALLLVAYLVAPTIANVLQYQFVIGIMALVFGIAGVLHAGIWIASWFRVTDGEGRRMPMLPRSVGLRSDRETR